MACQGVGAFRRCLQPARPYEPGAQDCRLRLGVDVVKRGTTWRDVARAGTRRHEGFRYSSVTPGQPGATFAQVRGSIDPATRPGSSVGTSVRLKIGRSAVRPRPWPPPQEPQVVHGTTCGFCFPPKLLLMAVRTCYHSHEDHDIVEDTGSARAEPRSGRPKMSAVRWMSQPRRVGGGYGEPTDTVRRRGSPAFFHGTKTAVSRRDGRNRATGGFGGGPGLGAARCHVLQQHRRSASSAVRRLRIEAGND